MTDPATKRPGARASFVPALRFHFLTRLYDPIIRHTLREARLRHLLVEQVDARPGHRVIVLGCGTGTLALALARRYPGSRVIGLDLDPDRLGWNVVRVWVADWFRRPAAVQSELVALVAELRAQPRREPEARTVAEPPAAEPEGGWPALPASATDEGGEPGEAETETVTHNGVVPSGMVPYVTAPARRLAAASSSSPACPRRSYPTGASRTCASFHSMTAPRSSRRPSPPSRKRSPRRQPMAIPSVGGMTVQLITLFIVPCMFSAVEEWKWRRAQRA